MIAYLKGKIVSKGVNRIVVETQGVGYGVFTTLSTLAKVRTGSEAAFYIHTHVREDQLSLYGFLNEGELTLFEMLISVSGIGPRIALAVMSGASVKNINSAIASGDASIFTKVSGVGKKTAERIIVELKEKVGAVDISSVHLSKQFLESLDALAALGYNKQEAREALRQVSAELSDTGAIVKQALRILGKH